ncbi:MAG: hypothetical protein BAJALOKI1v1_140026 [Promethearchaeota archaeon]|nr:MAG: hypothetical protein BAJALOKI1v1_140026 [Candidatus Lokiarchaeota archaeon]
MCIISMANFNNIEECLKEIERRYNENEKARDKLSSFHDPIQMTFSDTGRKVLLLINGDQGIEVKDNTADENAAVKIEFTEEQVLMDMFNGEIGGVKAYSSGKIKIVEGSIRNLMKLRKLMF